MTKKELTNNLIKNGIITKEIVKNEFSFFNYVLNISPNYYLANYCVIQHYKNDVDKVRISDFMKAQDELSRKGHKIDFGKLVNFKFEDLEKYFTKKTLYNKNRVSGLLINQHTHFQYYRSTIRNWKIIVCLKKVKILGKIFYFFDHTPILQFGSPNWCLNSSSTFYDYVEKYSQPKRMQYIFIKADDHTLMMQRLEMSKKYDIDMSHRLMKDSYDRIGLTIDSEFESYSSSLFGLVDDEGKGSFNCHANSNNSITRKGLRKGLKFNFTDLNKEVFNVFTNNIDLPAMLYDPHLGHDSEDQRFIFDQISYHPTSISNIEFFRLIDREYNNKNGIKNYKLENDTKIKCPIFQLIHKTQYISPASILDANFFYSKYLNAYVGLYINNNRGVQNRFDLLCIKKEFLEKNIQNYFKRNIFDNYEGPKFREYC
jgi:hypothetical protein